MATYRKKPVVIEAMQFPGVSVDNVDDMLAFEDWLNERRGDHRCRYHGGSLIIRAPMREYEAQAGDWIIRGEWGELWPCPPDIFEATYEPVPDGEGNGESDHGE